MMKITLTEQQVDMIQNHINEQNEERYRVILPVSVYAPRVTYMGNEINYISSSKIPITFDIDLEIRSWGIKTANIYAIKGDEQIEFEISYYNDNDDEQDEQIRIPVDWNNVVIKKNETSGSITITDPIEIELMNEESGNILIKSIEVYVNSF